MQVKGIASGIARGSARGSASVNPNPNNNAGQVFFGWMFFFTRAS